MQAFISIIVGHTDCLNEKYDGNDEVIVCYYL